MKQMTDYQRELVVQNMDLVEQVIKKRIKVAGDVLLTHEDYYQIGCEALCRAAMSYNHEIGSFVPLACRVIYNAIIDHCRKENAARFPKLEMDLDCDCDSYALSFMGISDDFDETVFYSDALEVLRKCKAAYSGITLRGIEALELKSLGYSTREIADRYETTVNNVNAWISRARAKLREDPQMLQFAL